jgi:hypothetical protein
MYIVIGKQDGYIRIIGQGFTIFVDSLSSFHGIIKHLHVEQAGFDKSISNDKLLVEQLTSLLKH